MQAHASGCAHANAVQKEVATQLQGYFKMQITSD